MQIWVTFIWRSFRDEARFNNCDVDPKCPLCRLENEDLQYFILRCPALGEVRERHFPQLRNLVIGSVGNDGWSRRFCNKDALVSLVVDCQKLGVNGTLPNLTGSLCEIEVCSRKLCYKLHQLGLKLHKGL